MSDEHNPAAYPNTQGLEALLDDVWNAAVEQAAVIANDCVHLTPDPGSAIRVMIDGRAKLHQSAKPFAETNMQLPQDVIDLVIAAREFWDDNNDLSDESTALDKALEAFASRVPYANEPTGQPCPHCKGLGAFSETGMDCGECHGGGEVEAND